jgi:ubiquinone/menaquinone biosynthesis C-methylase UbiE
MTGSALLANILLPGRTAKTVSHGIWSTLPMEQQADSYDKMARAYDVVVGNSLYNRIVWGASTSDYATEAREGLSYASAGSALDCGCGSLVFTARPYQSAPLDRMILFDRSLGMLRRGAARLPNGQFVQGDAFDMPFRSATFETIFAWGFLHVVGSRSPLLSELCRVAAPGAPITISSLVLTNRWVGNKMLGLLHSQGEAATPETEAEVIQAFSNIFSLTSHSLHGSMLILRGKVRG